MEEIYLDTQLERDCCSLANVINKCPHPLPKYTRTHTHIDVDLITGHSSSRETLITITCNSTMEKSHSDIDEDEPRERKIYQDFSRDGSLRSHRQTFDQGLFAERSGFAFPHQRLVILSLGLVSAALLIVAAVLGIYCAKAQDFKIPDSADTFLLAELKHFRNHTDVLRAKLEAQEALTKERTNHLQLKLQVKQKKTNTDILRGKIDILQQEKTALLFNKTTLEKNCARCPPEWIFLKSSCYYFSNSDADLASRKNWADSRADCIRKGGDLLVINSLEEQQLVSDNFPKVTSASTWWLNGFWMGLTYKANQGSWVWINNVTEVSSMYWRSGQPNHSGIQSGNCAAFLYFSDTMRTWYNGNCSQHRMNWICEMDPTSI